MTNQPKVSVIVPVYNAEPYLTQCLESIVSQTLTEIEIICVDDGSTDGSLETLGRFSAEDSRITVLFQEHQYAGNARNKGKAAAHGKYLVFWDADDYFKPDALRLMYEQCEADEADICICSGRQYFEDQGFEAPGTRYIRPSEIPDTIPFNRFTAPDHVISITVEAPWNKMFRRSYIEGLKLDFKGTRNANDVFFVISAMALAERITLVNKQLVVYRRNKGGGLVSTVSKGIMTAFQTWLDTAEYLKEKDAFPTRSFANRAIESVVYLLNNTKDWPAFREAYLFMQAGNLEKLGITAEEDDTYYYISYHNEASKRMYTDTPEEFSRWLGNLFSLREAAAVSKNRRDNENNKKTISSLKKKNEEKEKKEKSLSADLKKKDETLQKREEEIRKLKEKAEKNAQEIAALKKDFKELQKKEAAAEKKQAAAEKKLNEVRNSLSYKIGRVLTWLPRKIKKLFRKK